MGERRPTTRQKPWHPPDRAGALACRLAGLLGLVAALLSCDACRSPTGEADLEGYVPATPPGLSCAALAPFTLPSSDGIGPVLGSAVAGAGDSFYLLYDGQHEGRPGVALTRMGANLAGRQTEWLDTSTAGPVVAEALATDPSGLAAAVRQHGGRRVYLFSKLADGPLHRIDLPELGALDRRVSMRLLAAPPSGGIQVVTAVSGDDHADVGRLAGSLLATRPVALPALELAPEPAAAPNGELWLLTAESGGQGGHPTIRLHRAAGDDASSSDIEVASVEAGVRVLQTLLVPFGTGWEAVWVVGAGDRTELRRAFVDPATGAASPEPTLMPEAPDGTIERVAAAAQGGHLWLVWAEHSGPGWQLGLAVTDSAGAALGQVALGGGAGAPAGLQLVATGPGLVLAWRALSGDDQANGPVQVSALPCTLGGLSR